MILDLVQPSWTDDGNCRNEQTLEQAIAENGGQPIDMFPDDVVIEEPDAKPDYLPALKLCANCPVQLDCLQYAIDNNLTDGVWGGMTPPQREAHRKELSLLEHGKLSTYTQHNCRCGSCKEAVRVYFADRRHPIAGADYGARKPKPYVSTKSVDTKETSGAKSAAATA